MIEGVVEKAQKAYSRGETTRSTADNKVVTEIGSAYSSDETEVFPTHYSPIFSAASLGRGGMLAILELEN
jgi:hypothetical protein